MIKEAFFSGGCFWHIQEHFNNFDGVSSIVGYSNGYIKNPSYKDVCQGKTGHSETIKILYNSRKISYKKLCIEFFKIHNYKMKKKTQYQSIIFYINNYQENLAKKIINSLKNCHTKLMPFKNFYRAEEYHQNYLDKIKNK